MLTRRRLEHELDEEFRTHLELSTAEHIRRGLSPDAARARARRDLGCTTHVREQWRDARGFTPLDDLLTDLRHVSRGRDRTWRGASGRNRPRPVAAAVRPRPRRGRRGDRAERRGVHRHRGDAGRFPLRRGAGLGADGRRRDAALGGTGKQLGNLCHRPDAGRSDVRAGGGRHGARGAAGASRYRVAGHADGHPAARGARRRPATFPARAVRRGRTHPPAGLREPGQSADGAR